MKSIASTNLFHLSVEYIFHRDGFKSKANISVNIFSTASIIFWGSLPNSSSWSKHPSLASSAIAATAATLFAMILLSSIKADYYYDLCTNTVNETMLCSSDQNHTNECRMWLIIIIIF